MRLSERLESRACRFRGHGRAFRSAINGADNNFTILPITTYYYTCEQARMETRTRTADWLLGESSLAEDDSAGLSDRPVEGGGKRWSAVG